MTSVRRLSSWLGMAVLAAMLALAALALPPLRDGGPDGTATGQERAGQERTGPSGLPLPRFVSLKADRVNVRVGPSQEHRVSWTFARAGLPVEIVAESGNWRRIRDSEGDEGWVFHSLLSGRRTGMVAPWSQEDTLALRRRAGADAGLVALVEPGVLVDIIDCDGRWCRVSVDRIDGWINQEQLWGVYPREVVH